MHSFLEVGMETQHLQNDGVAVDPGPEKEGERELTCLSNATQAG